MTHLRKWLFIDLFVNVFVVVQSFSCVWLFVTQWTAACQASLSFTLLEFAKAHVHWISDAIQSSHPLLSPSPPAFNLSQHQGLFQWVSSLHQRAKYWSFGFSISPSNEYSVYFPLGWTSLISLLSKGQTLKSLLQHNSSKASFFSSQSSLWSNSHICTWLLEKP